MKDITILQDMDNFLLKKEFHDRQDSKKRTPGRYWPSEASITYIENGFQFFEGKCAREVWYGVNNLQVTNPTDILGAYRMRAGILYEDEERRVATKMKIIASEEDFPRRFTHNLTDDIIVSGEIDIPFLIDDEYIIAEIKSGYGYYFDKEVFKLGTPKAKHLMQLCIYLDHFKDKVKRGVLLYINRGDTKKRTFEVVLLDNGCVTVDGQIHPFITLSGIYDRFMYIDYHVKNNTPPNGDYTPVYSEETIKKLAAMERIPKTHVRDYQKGKRACLGDYACSYCDYKNLCVKEQGQRKDI